MSKGQSLETPFRVYGCSTAILENSESHAGVSPVGFSVVSASLRACSIALSRVSACFGHMIAAHSVLVRTSQWTYCRVKLFGDSINAVQNSSFFAAIGVCLRDVAEDAGYPLFLVRRDADQPLIHYRSRRAPPLFLQLPNLTMKLSRFSAKINTPSRVPPQFPRVPPQFPSSHIAARAAQIVRPQLRDCLKRT